MACTFKLKTTANAHGGRNSNSHTAPTGGRRSQICGGLTVITRNLRFVFLHFQLKLTVLLSILYH